MVRQELAGRVDLQGMDLVKGNQLVPPRLSPGKDVELLGRRQETAIGVKVGLLVLITDIMPVIISLATGGENIRVRRA